MPPPAATGCGRSNWSAWPARSAVFVGLVVGLSTREWVLAAIFFGAIFIVSLVVLAMLSLAAGSPSDELSGSDDDRPGGH